MATLGDLSRQAYHDWDCIVVMQGDSGEQLAGRMKAILGHRLRVYYLGEPNASLARNVGLLESTSDVVLYLDDDVVIETPDFLSAHARHYRSPDCVGVAGQILEVGGVPRHTRHWASRLKQVGWLYFPRNYAFECRTLNGGSGNLSVWRQAAVEVGGMDAQFEKGAHREESDFCLRLTGRFGELIFDPEASLVHIGENSGGCRTWGSDRGIHPLHHVCGEWYFIRKHRRIGTVRLLDLPHHFYALARRQVFNGVNLSEPSQTLRALRRSIEGYRAASAKLKAKPREIGTLKQTDYTEMGSGK